MVAVEGGRVQEQREGGHKGGRNGGGKEGREECRVGRVMEDGRKGGGRWKAGTERRREERGEG